MNEAVRHWIERKIDGLAQVGDEHTLESALTGLFGLLASMRKPGADTFHLDGLIATTGDAHDAGLVRLVERRLMELHAEACRLHGVAAADDAIEELEEAHHHYLQQRPPRPHPDVDAALGEIAIPGGSSAVRIRVQPPSGDAATALARLTSEQSRILSPRSPMWSLPIAAIAGRTANPRHALHPHLEGLYARTAGIHLSRGGDEQLPADAEPVFAHPSWLVDATPRARVAQTRIGSWGRATLLITHVTGEISMIPWELGAEWTTTPLAKSLPDFLRRLASDPLPRPPGTEPAAMRR